ncbi:MAG: hypothetical protein AAGH65_10925 [Pseudomonadota bacterium]
MQLINPFRMLTQSGAQAVRNSIQPGLPRRWVAMSADLLGLAGLALWVTAWMALLTNIQ